MNYHGRDRRYFNGDLPRGQRAFLLAGGAVLILTAAAMGQSTQPAATRAGPVGGGRGATLHADVEYGKAEGGVMGAAGAATRASEGREGGEGGKVSLKLDASVPGGVGPYPIVIMVHGGGWSSGDKQQDITPMLEAMTGRFTWFSINYRVAPQNPWPACLEDVQTAIRWVKAHGAEYKGDTRRIALMGHSAGGHLVCLAATLAVEGGDETTRVQAVVGLAPVTDLEADTARRGGLSKSLQALLGQSAATPVSAPVQAKLHEMSPIQHLKTGLPAFLLVQGSADKTVPIEQTKAFADKARAAGVACEMLTIDGGVHAVTDWGKASPEYEEKMLGWVERVLSEKP